MATNKQSVTEPSAPYIHQLKHPLPSALLLGSVIFIGELAVMLLLMIYPIDKPLLEAVIDSAVLLAMISPALYFFAYRPLRCQIIRARTSEDEVRLLSQRLLNVTEEEQRRIALDLHDELGQSLSALQLEMEAMQGPLHRAAPQFEARCDRLLQHLREMHQQVRSIAGRLRPTLLDDLGIIPALEGLVDDLAANHLDVDLSLQITGIRKRPEPAVETAIYRLCQEGLNNALRHAKAHKIEILLTASYPELILTIRDDGIGFTPEASPHRGLGGSLGLVGMRERAASLNGHFSLQTAAGKGTQIRVTLPCKGIFNELDSHSDR